MGNSEPTDEAWPVTAARVDLPGAPPLYFFSMSEWAGDWTPVFVIDDGGGKSRRRHLQINSVDKATDTELFLCPPSQLLVLAAWGAFQRVDLTAKEPLIELDFERHIDQACPQRQRLGLVRPLPRPACCWSYVPHAPGVPGVPSVPGVPGVPSARSAPAPDR